MLSRLLSLARKIKRRLRGPVAGPAPCNPPETAPLGLREWAANTYLEGQGIEIGALQNPLKLPSNARVQYVDRLPVAELRQQYPELGPLPLVEVDILDDGERLSRMADESQDFVIANHFLEHCGDPIGTLQNFLRVVRPNGILYMAVPDKRFTFDRDRPVTPLAHLFEDHHHGPERSRRQHFDEWVRLVNKIDEPARAEAAVQSLLDRDYSIHFHVWTQTEFLEFLHALQPRLSFEIELFLKHGQEMIVVLRKVPAANAARTVQAA